MARKLSCLLALVLLCGCMHDGKPLPSPSQAAKDYEASYLVLPAANGGEALYIVIARDFLSLRVRPDASSDRVKKLASGAMVRMLEEDGEFAHIEEVATGLRGYSLRKYLAALPADIARPTPAPERAAGRYRVAAEEYLSLRSGPDIAAERLATVEAGETVDVVAFEGNYAKVEYGGLTGYVLSTYLQPLREEEPPPAREEAYTASGDVQIVSAQEYMSLRTAPDSASERISKLPRGERVSVLALAGEFAYVEVEATGERGYVLAEFLMGQAAYDALPPREDIDIRYVDAAQYLTLREEASTAATALGKVTRGEQVAVERREGDFAYISTAAGEKGYVLDGYLSSLPPVRQQTGLYRVLAKEYISLREQPSSASPRIAKLDAGAQVKLLSLEGMFAMVEADGRQGYVLSGYIAPQNGEALTSSLSVVKPGASYAPHEVGEALSELAAKYPDRLRVVSAGRSLKDRDLPVALLGNPKAQRHILVQAGIHAREYMTTALVLAQIEDMLARPEAAYDGAEYAWLLDNVLFHIMPTTNPDGAAISQGARATDALSAIYAADTEAGLTELPMEDYFRMWKANAAGVDLNRNFEAGWSSLAGPAAPSQARYKGDSPADQPETRALVEYAGKYDFDATVSYHAYGSVIYWEYGSDQRVLDASRSLARAVRAVTRYPLAGSGGLDAGGFKDWAMEMRSIPSITVEIGTRECPLPEDEFLSLWERNRDVLPALAHWSL